VGLARAGAAAAAVLALVGLVQPVAADEGDASPKPPIVVIVADDLGYGDVSYQGRTDVATPNIDTLAAGGVRFTDGYASCPVCSPTRAGLLTGRYQQRFGHELNPGNELPEDLGFRKNLGLPNEEVTIADILQEAGYVTGMVGKWHLGFDDNFHPLVRGFDEFFGFLGGGHSYLDVWPRSRILSGWDPVRETEYLTDAFTREGVAFIERHAGEPFFLYLPYNAVHTPLQATEEYLDDVSDIESKNRRVYAAMTAALDVGVGRVLAALKEAGVEEEAVVIFISDNGGVMYLADTDSSARGGEGAASVEAIRRSLTEADPIPSPGRNAPLKGGKAFVHEGGIRVPFLVRWPAVLPAGEVYRHPVISLDILPTAVAAAGGELPSGREIDGVDLVPYLKGQNPGQPHEALFWRHGPNSAVRMGDWKLLRYEPNPWRLYNLAEDIHEDHDLAGEHPEVVRTMTEAYRVWEAKTVAPRWQVRRPSTIEVAGEMITIQP
jgi:arylsulfatase A-like enzyme